MVVSVLRLRPQRDFGLRLRLSRNVHQLLTVEGPLLVSRENHKVPRHCFDALIVRADLANRAIHTDEWRGNSGQDSDAVSDFEIMHPIDSLTFYL